MTTRPGDFDPPKLPPCVSTEELRCGLSQIVNRAAYGGDPVLIAFRGRKIAAIVSMDDLALLQRMKRRREEIRAAEVPNDVSKIGEAMAAHLKWELFFG
jgi:prevent-host-death family protein